MKNDNCKTRNDGLPQQQRENDARKQLETQIFYKGSLDEVSSFNLRGSHLTEDWPL